MGTELELRDRAREEYRELLFDALTDADVGETIEIVADRDLDVHLVRYQIERDRGLEWTYADPDDEPRELQVTKGATLDGDLGAIDVRDLRPQRRHQALLTTFDELEVGEGFVLVNDHDPKPLYHELKSMHGDVIDWEYRSRGSDGWRVEVVRTAESDAVDTDVVTRYDVREIPKEERHPTIHHRYGMIPEGGTLELIAPHEPRPLHREFHQRYGDSFSWAVLEEEPGRCRVHITKGDEPDGDVESSGSTDADAEEVATGAAPDDGTVEVIEELDVRDLPPARRHERIFDGYADLEAGTGFVLVNDHDPKPLYHQFEAEAGPEFRWEYRQKEPGEFRVLIGKSDGGDRDAAVGREPTADGPEPPF
ncbi:DUF2249 domain-containing protein [Haloglomus litoreum]|uniref:DUF2249 domain-containing protein n=1 Tax=Haloglomus litoreum TaxID=3034026 RepID=UPI0023E843CC|nr:DUF2249 domain-containing protein [Haloglomus sp. DT116]